MSAVDHDAFPAGVAEPFAGFDMLLDMLPDLLFCKGILMGAVFQILAVRPLRVDPVADVCLDLTGRKELSQRKGAVALIISAVFFMILKYSSSRLEKSMSGSNGNRLQ